MTIKEIAEALNVSISTVSKALNDATDIAEETKATVRKYAESQGYPMKSKNRDSRRICVMYERVDSDIRNHVFAPVVSAFTDVAVRNNYEVIVDTVFSKPDDFELENYLKQNNFCAAFIMGMNFKSPIYGQLKKTTLPLVLMDNRVPNCPLISSVSSENTAAIITAMFHLQKLGHTKIGFLMGEKFSLVSAERLAGYILGLAHAGQDFKNEYVYYGDFTKEAGERAAKFFSNSDVTAIISCSDIMAIGLIDGLAAVGKKVPEDISVIGFDDLSILKFTPYSLTTMKQDYGRMGEHAFQQIREMLDGRISQNVYLPCQLIERNSVKQL